MPQGGILEETRKTNEWQRKLLPVMIGMLITLTLFFFVASFMQLHYLRTRIEKAPELDLSHALKMVEEGISNATVTDKFRYAQWQTLVLLESHVLKRRYHQANVLLMSRTWVKYLGFVTGMTLALVGAAFVLGKLREPESHIDAESTMWRFSMKTASPGLILALLGAILMIAAMVTHFEIEVRDVPTYTEPWLEPSVYRAILGKDSVRQTPDKSEKASNGRTVEEILKGVKEKMSIENNESSGGS